MNNPPCFGEYSEEKRDCVYCTCLYDCIKKDVGTERKHSEIKKAIILIISLIAFLFLTAKIQEKIVPDTSIKENSK